MSKASNVTATLLVGDNKMERARDVPGAIWFYRKDGFGDGAGILHSCPCGCGKIGALNLDPSEQNRPCWTMTGPREQPTLSPSVGIRPWDSDSDVEADGFHWHGWLRDGVWRSV